MLMEKIKITVVSPEPPTTAERNAEIDHITKAFHDVLVIGEQLLNDKIITWEQYAYTMRGFEIKLEQMGVEL